MWNFLVERFGSNGFAGEHLWLGHLGNFFIIFSFAASLLAFISYFAAEFSRGNAKEISWRNIARGAFIAQSSAVFGIFVLLFVMIQNHWFEYHYAWRHSSTDLELKYIISSFWEGQEGSFLLWMFWMAVLGCVGIKTVRDYENPVMGVISLTQFFLASMVLGIFVAGQRIGSTPFILLRNEMDLVQMAPVVFSNPDNLHNYLNFIKDGNGLNELLQNYWMTIHPPVLFLGFASVTFPFAFVLASLLRRDWHGWVKAAMPWTLFSVAILGTGILMGGAWAYESLSFGGFWAWDPVENMSFVPWLMVVAGLHMLVVYRYTKHSLISTYVFFILAFGFVLYSTFLTRSGILGDTSVHAFTDLGMTGQLLLYLAFFLVVAFTLLFIRIFKKEIPQVQQEEELLSREFWMFIGSLVIFLSAIQMTFTTSIPVWNIILEPLFKKMDWAKLAPPEKVVEHYNSIQIWLGILAAVLTGVGQYFAYKFGKVPSTFKWSTYSFGAALLLSVGISYGLQIDFTHQYIIDFTRVSEKIFFKFPFVSPVYIFLCSALYAVFANLSYLVFVLKGNWKLSGGSISHFGFGLFLLGVIISQGKQQVISTQGVALKEFDSKERAENILLLRDSSEIMGDYKVTYIGTEQHHKNTLYLVRYEKQNSSESFILKPESGLLKGGNLNSNPDTKHYLTKDVFTHVTSIPDNTHLKDSVHSELVAVGDSFFTKNALVVVAGANRQPVLPENTVRDGKLFIGLDLTVRTAENKTYTAQPVLSVDVSAGSLDGIPAEVSALGLSFDIVNLDPQSKKFTLTVHEKELPVDFIIMKAIVFPYIKLVWLGGILTFLGAIISMVRRRKERESDSRQ